MSRTTSPTAAPEQPSPRLPWLAVALACAALIALTCLVYLGDLRLGFFHLDDTTYVVENALITSLGGGNLERILTEIYFSNYSPLHLLSYSLDHAIAGLDPFAFHLSSNLWAGVVAATVLLLGLALRLPWPVALGGAVLFVAHPAHVEAVAWISSRKDLVAAALAVPSAMAYVRYGRGGSRRWAWYVLSVVLFLLAVAGKQSVVVLPAILLLWDLLAQRRRDWAVLVLDKLPFLAVVVLFSMRTMTGQPTTGHDFSFSIMGRSLLHSLWLLTGFGEHVLYRARPEPQADMGLAFLWALLVAALLVTPLLMRRWLPPLVIVLLYWVLLSLLPPQVLTLVHPVSDRYLFFPSVAACLLIAWGVWALAARIPRHGPAVGGLALAGLAGLWGWRTVTYVQEWQDPRSVWHAASFRSADVFVHVYLATHYQEIADQLDPRQQQDDPDVEPLKLLAEVVWLDDPRREALGEALDRGDRRDPAAVAFRDRLLDLARESLDRGEQVRGTRVVPNLYFRRGKLELERANFEAARRDFRSAFDHAQRHTYEPLRNEYTVRCIHAQGLVAWQSRDYETALRLIRQAEQEQARLGGRWVPDIEQHRARLERMVGE